MKDSIFNNKDLITPAYVYDQDNIIKTLGLLAEINEKSGCFILYSIKSANVVELLKIIQPYVAGFSCSSLFEVQLAKEVLDDSQTVHITTPGYRNDELDKILTFTDFVTLNSSSQVKKYSNKVNDVASCGIRINPELSYVKDERYDPCRTSSKLGLSINDIVNNQIEIDWQSIEGIHIHNNCESIDFGQLKQSIDKVISSLPASDLNLKWFNLGGGYLFDKQTNIAPLLDTVKQCQDNFNVDVYFEPGKAITGHAGYLVSTVIDIFNSNGKNIAILDTTINHLPEVFEYQYQPLVMNTYKQSDYAYRLSGSSCLSGDLFGDYFFDEPLEIGSRIIFENVGAYMQVKANMFNGINLPTTYILDGTNQFKLLKKYDYDFFRSRV